ncbi:MAG: transporter, partial [Bacilli bacterium]|nr:transporter [Bacilli bacterium]
MILTGNSPPIERLQVTRLTWQIILLAGFAWFIESLSIGSLGVILEPIKQIMHLTPEETGMLSSSSTFGIVLGLIPAGYLADRFGRKQILVWGIVFYSLFTLLCSFSTNFEMLVCFRFLSGLGMGAVFPLPYAIVSEFVGGKQRTFFSGLLDAFLSVGYFLAPLLGLLILPNFPSTVAWRVFFAISALPVFYALVIHMFLPESPVWLAEKDRQAEAQTVMRSVSVFSP